MQRQDSTKDGCRKARDGTIAELAQELQGQKNIATRCGVAIFFFTTTILFFIKGIHRHIGSYHSEGEYRLRENLQSLAHSSLLFG